MHILKVGFNYKSAPVEIREKLVFPEQALPQAMIRLKEQKSILENVIISTCNRTEIYAVVDQLHTGRYYITQFLEDWFHISKNKFAPYLEVSENDGAIEHLFKLVAGLDSMILGETQILGQVRDAFLSGQKEKTTGTIFNKLFKQAITFAKRTHHDTGIGENAVSVSYAAVELAKKIFGTIENKQIVIVGAGEMGELAVKNLHGSGAAKITIVNRTYEKAVEFAQKYSVNAEHLEKLPQLLQQADILISSTGADSFILGKDEMEKMQQKRKNSPLFMVDIAVPRDVDPVIGQLENVFLYDIDDLQHIVDENFAARKQAAAKIMAMIPAEKELFKEWVIQLGVVPVISALRKKALAIQEETMKSIERKMPRLTEREKKLLEKHTQSIVNQLLKEPITKAKELAATDEANEALSLFMQIFGIEEEAKKELQRQAQKRTVMKEAKNDEKIPFGFH